ncbi:hypothetical protein UT300002_30830 [Clostridium perfringens]
MPSCCINIDKNYWCHLGISKGENFTKFAFELEKVNAKDAICKLADMLGIESENNITNKNKY